MIRILGIFVTMGVAMLWAYEKILKPAPTVAALKAAKLPALLAAAGVPALDDATFTLVGQAVGAIAFASALLVLLNVSRCTFAPLLAVLYAFFAGMFKVDYANVMAFERDAQQQLLKNAFIVGALLVIASTGKCGSSAKNEVAAAAKKNEKAKKN